MKEYKQGMDGKGFPIPGCYGWSDSIYANVLGATTAEHIHVPTGAKKVRLTGTIAFWVKMAGETAAIPSDEVADGTGSMYIPAGVSVLVELDGAAVIGLIAGAACTVVMEFFA